MLAERFLTRTDREGRLAGLSALPPDEGKSRPSCCAKNLHYQKLRGSATWIGDPAAPVYDPAEWNGIEAEMEQEWPELLLPSP